MIDDDSSLANLPLYEAISSSESVIVLFKGARFESVFAIETLYLRWKKIDEIIDPMR